MISAAIMVKGCIENAYTSASRPMTSGPLGPDARKVLRDNIPGDHREYGLMSSLSLEETCNLGIPKVTHTDLRDINDR